MPASPAPSTGDLLVRRADEVTAVLVAHDGATWLPEALAALAAQEVAPGRLVAVDTGSTDGSLALLQAATPHVLQLPRTTGFGAAVAAALAQAQDSRWVWLLHDDCAPAPDALARLLEHGEQSPSTALLGAKAVDWSHPRFLVDIGVTTDSAGHRETGLERHELDQGQHDAVRDVLAVGTAGALVRREVWDALGGLDPQLPVFRDDLDLGWRVNAAGHRVVVVPQATVRHARAATTGRRTTDAAHGRPEGVDRRNALYVLLAHAPLGRLPVVLTRLVLGSLLRVLGFLLTRQVLEARDELAAVGTVLLRPSRLLRARRRRARSRTVPTRALRPLFAPRGHRLRNRTELLGTWLAGGTSGTSGLGALGDGGPDSSDEFDADTAGGPSLVGRVLLRPPVLLVLALALVALVAERSVLSTTGGVLAGGRLLPAPDGAGALWGSYAASWHTTSVGSDAPASPAVAVLAVLSTLLLGKAWLAVDLLLLGSVPLAGATAYVASGAVVRSRPLRLWAAATWALLPVATGAVAAGRLDAAAVQVALPLLLLAGGHLLTRDPSQAGWRHAWALGLGLSVTTALAPTLWLPAVALLVGGGLAALALAAPALRPSATRRLLAASVAAGLPVLLLAPWSLEALRHPGLVLHGPGRTADESALVDRGLSGLDLALLSPGGAGLPPVWVTAGLLLAALAGPVRLHRRGLALGAWAAALTALLVALVLSRSTAGAAATGEQVALWPGTALQVAGGAMVLAALVAAHQARERLARRDFGWRQATAAAVAVLAAALPVVAAGTWLVRGAEEPLRRDLVPLLPAFALAELDAATGSRVLVLDAADGARTTYAVTAGGGERLGDTETAPEPAQRAALDDAVADLLTASGGDAAAALATRAVRYVALAADGAGDLPRVLDGQSGLVRRSSGELLLWEVVDPAARLVVLPADVAAVALGQPGSVPARGPQPGQARPQTTSALPAGPAGRLLVLSEAADPGWVAEVDGQPLERRTAWGWAAAWELPASGGALEVRHDRGPRTTALVLQGAGVLLAAVLAAPAARRHRGLEDDDWDDDQADGQADDPREQTP